MLLYVMRHGPAEDRAPTGRDFDRALTAPGREVVARSAEGLRQARLSLGARGWRVLSSTFRRARETAEIVAAAASPVPLEVELRDALGADQAPPFDLVAELAAAGTDALLVGHQPTVEELVRALVDSATRPRPPAAPGAATAPPPRIQLAGGFRTGIIVVLERIAPDRWHPTAVLDPYRPDG